MSKLDELKKQMEKDKTTTEDTVDKKVDELTKEIDISDKVKLKEGIKKGDVIFSDADKKKMVDKTLSDYKNKNVRLLRREKKMIRNLEYDHTRNTQGIAIGLTVVGLIFLMLLRDFLPNDAMYTLIILIGSFLFIPTGMIMGWILLDPVMRCKIIRKVSRRNYGVVNFVGKGKRIISKIKNFDYGLIWQHDNCWVLTKDKIYQLTKNGNAANEGFTLDPDSILTLVDTVPVIFVDMDSMEPLSIIQRGRVPVYPSEIGPACKAWMDIQRAKQLAQRKTLDTVLIIAVVCCIGAVVISFFTMNKVDELTITIDSLNDKINSLTPHVP